MVRVLIRPDNEIVKVSSEKNVSLIRITQESGIPLIGHLSFGILDKYNNNMIQVRATTVCNMKCGFCSTSANDFKMHPVNYIVEVDYLIKWVKEIAKMKGNNLQIFLDSVGDPLTHPDFVSLVRELRKIPQISNIIVITNGTLLTKEKIDALEKAGLTRINISLHSLDKEKCKWLFGNKFYDLDKVIEIIKYAAKSKIKIMLTPVLLFEVNEKDIEDIIKFAKEIGCLVGVQNYENYKYSRKLKEAKKTNYWKFYEYIKKLEKKYNIPLRFQNVEFGIEKRPKLESVFDIGEKINVEIKAPGWMKDQMIAVAKNRCITVAKCKRDKGDKVNIRITENKNNIYLAEMV